MHAMHACHAPHAHEAHPSKLARKIWAGSGKIRDYSTSHPATTRAPYFLFPKMPVLRKQINVCVTHSNTFPRGRRQAPNVMYCPLVEFKNQIMFEIIKEIKKLELDIDN